MDADWSARIEAKLDRIAEAFSGHVAEDRAVAADVEMLKKTTEKLKEAEAKRKGAADLIVVLSLLATISVGVIEFLRYTKT